MDEANNYSYRELLHLTRRVIQAFDQVEQRSWTVEGAKIELMKPSLHPDQVPLSGRAL
ncbi:MAG: hypothetical protein ACR2JC_13660 [Chloroflexota bacterium]